MRKWMRIRQITLILLSVICSEILLPAGGLTVSAAVEELDSPVPSEVIATMSDAAISQEPAAGSNSASSGENPNVRMVRPATPADADWVEASTFEELEDAMGYSQKIRLGDDITISGFHYIISSQTEPTYIDTDGHTIYVEGIVSVFGAVVSGANRDGLFCVREGGILSLYGTTLKPEGGYAFWQEEGSGFMHGEWRLTVEDEGIPCSFDGELHYADSPVAWYPKDVFDFSDGNEEAYPDPYFLFGAGTPYDSGALPGEAAACWCYEGSLYSGRLPVKWNTEDCREDLEKKERTVLTGSYGAGMVTMKTSEPKLLTVFQRAEAGIWLTCEYWDNPNTPRMILKFLPARPNIDPDEYVLEVSMDGTQWMPLDHVNCSGPDASGAYTYKRYFHVWNGETVPRYYCIRTQDHENEFYSDIIMISEEYSFVRGDIDGTRGGGTQIGDSERPPDSSGDNSITPPVTPPEGDTTESPSDPPEGDTTDPPFDPSEGDSTDTPPDPPKGDTTETPSDPPEGDTTDTPSDPPQGDTTETPAVPPQGDTTDTPSDSPKGDTAETPAAPPQGDTTEIPAALPQGDATKTPINSPKGDTTETPAASPRGDIAETPPDFLQQRDSAVSPVNPPQGDSAGNSGYSSQAEPAKNQVSPLREDSTAKLKTEVSLTEEAVQEAASSPIDSPSGQLLAGWAAVAGITSATLWFTLGGGKKITGSVFSRKEPKE